MEKLTIVIPFYNGLQYIKNLVRDLSNFDNPVIIVDDLSDTALQMSDLGKRLPQSLRIFRPKDKGYFAGAVNYGISVANKDHDILVLNQDARLSTGETLDIIEAKRRTYALIGERIKGNHPAHSNGYVHGTFMFMRRDAINLVGGLDAKRFPLWGCTADWQLRVARKGYKILPLTTLPGFSHNRPGNIGSSIQNVIKKRPQDKELFLRTPPLVSVIVPCYNHGQYLQDLVNSMIGGKTSFGLMPGQDFTAFEIILVDDCSTDDSWKIMNSLADPWKGIYCVRRDKNGGTAAAENTGIKMAHGRAIAILAADDMMQPTRLSVMYDVWEKNQSRLIYDDLIMFSDEKHHQEFKLPDYDFDKLIYKNHVPGGIMVSKKIVDKIGGYPEQMVKGREDWAMAIKLGLAGCCGIHIPQPLYLYRRAGQNRTLTNTNKVMKVEFLAQLKALFPTAYDEKGNKSMCCGKKTVAKGAAVKPSGGVQPMSIPGKNGLTLLRYVGANFGTSTWYGVSTGQQYKFGINKPVGYVDDRDLTTGNPNRPGFLEIIELGKRVFVVEKVVQEKPLAVPQAAPVVPAAAVAVPSTKTLAEEVVEEGAPQETEAVIDLAGMTLAEIRKHIEKLDKSVYPHLAEQERNGRNRISVIKLLNQYA